MELNDIKKALTDDKELMRDLEIMSSISVLTGALISHGLITEKEFEESVKEIKEMTLNKIVEDGVKEYLSKKEN